MLARPARSARLEYAARDGERFFDAAQNARLVANAERYYRAMYYGSRESWNLRDQHMFETLKRCSRSTAPESEGVVWAHNSHIGDAAATEMGARGELNVGQLCRASASATARYLIGFGTDHGTVAAAHRLGRADARSMRVRPAHPESYERLCHEAGVPRLPAAPARAAPRRGCATSSRPPRLERAIGVIYRPETELQSHYFQASLPAAVRRVHLVRRDRAVTPLAAHQLAACPTRIRSACELRPPPVRVLRPSRRRRLGVRLGSGGDTAADRGVPLADRPRSGGRDHRRDAGPPPHPADHRGLTSRPGIGSCGS